MSGLAVLTKNAKESAGEDVVLELKGVTRRFGEVVAVDDVSLRARRGQIVGLLGHNGAGKTTLVRLLSGLLRPDTGTIRVGGRDPAQDGVPVRRQLGVLPSSQLVDLRLTARENLEFVSRLFGVQASGARSRIDTLLEEFGIANRADERVSTYSAGMRQRVALAWVLLPEPEILLLDEPSSSLDPVGAKELHELIRRSTRSQGRTVVICTHDLVEAAELCDEVLILAKGRLLVSGSPKELAARLDSATTVDLECDEDDHDEAVKVLRSGADVEEQGAGTFRLTGVDRRTTAALVDDLVAAGVRVYAVEPRRQTLADLYFSLHADVGTGNEGSTT